MEKIQRNPAQTVDLIGSKICVALISQHTFRQPHNSRIALTGTRVMNRMLVEGGRCRVGRMTVCGLGFCHDIRAPGGQAQRECCYVCLRASMPAGRGKPGHIIKSERLGPAPRFPPAAKARLRKQGVAKMECAYSAATIASPPAQRRHCASLPLNTLRSILPFTPCDRPEPEYCQKTKLRPG